MYNLFKFRIKALALIAILLVSAVSASAQIDTIAIIDAGSSGSRLYVYAVEISKKTVNCIYPSTTTPVNSSKGEALAGIADNKDSVMTFLKGMTAKYSNMGKKQKKLYVLATAGMRQIPVQKTQKIYSLMKDSIQTCNNYKVECAMTISGQYEGLYAWIAANYEQLKKTPTGTSDTKGILEIGGASMQITFVPLGVVQSNDKISENRSQLSVSLDTTDIIQHPKYGVLFSKSYINGGVNAVYESKCVPNLSTVKRYLGSTSVYGLGGTINGAKKAADEAKKPLVKYLNEYNEKLPHEQSATHYVENTYYLICVLAQLNLLTDDKITPQDAGWTKGAAFDIVINKHAPVEFDYNKQN